MEVDGMLPWKTTFLYKQGALLLPCDVFVGVYLAFPIRPE